MNEWMKLILLFSKDALQWWEVTIKTFTILQKVCTQINAVFELAIYKIILKKCPKFKKCKQQLISTFIIIRKVYFSYFLLLFIICITGINYILKDIQIENSYFKL